jgi:parallel beta-helix repeat protein
MLLANKQRKQTQPPNVRKFWHSLLLISTLLLAFGPSAQATPNRQGVTPTYTVIKDNKNQNTIWVQGTGASVTLAEIVAGLGAANVNYLVNPSGTLWQLNANLLIWEGVTLTLSPATGVTELRLRSDSNGAVVSSAINEIDKIDEIDSVAAINYKSFVYLKTENGTMVIDGVKVQSWDPATDTPDSNYRNGRAYILAKFAATLNVYNADIGYLGAADGESYGISWRDDDGGGNVLRTRVTGEMINSKVHHNYYGIYTYQAQNMTFRGNEFYSNVRYGFDPHDYSHHILVENNVARDNGAHGFIISRGCNNFIFRNNISFNNRDPGSNLAHGFMLDPGGAGISKPQVSSSNNLFENNEAYGNEGYGMRILGSGDNEIRNNYFHHNQIGMTVDGANVDSATVRNLIQNNRLEENSKGGIMVREAHQNQFLNNNIKTNLGDGIDLRKSNQNEFTGNTISGSGDHGVLLNEASKQNLFKNNTIQGNQSYGISVIGSTTTGNRWSQNLIFANVVGGIESTTQLLAAPLLQTITGNNISGQAKAGVTVELFGDNGAQGQFYLGQATADSNGGFTFTNNSGWVATHVTAIAIEGTTNASAFSAALPVGDVILPTPTSTATPTATETATSTPTPTGTLVVTATATPTVAPSVTGTVTPPPTVTPTGTITPVSTPVSTPGVTPTRTPTATPTVAVTPGGTGTDYRLYLPTVRK